MVIIDNDGIKRQNVINKINKGILENIQSLWNLKNVEITIHPQYDGCQNLIYYLTNNDNELILRISFREDRSIEQIQAETHFINYLSSNGALVAYPIKSKNDSFVEIIKIENMSLFCVIFIKAKGYRLPDKDYKYREGVSIDEYFHNYGKTLGIMHRLAKDYLPVNEKIKRPDWINNMENIFIPKYLPNNKNIIKSNFDRLIKEAKQLLKDKDSFGLIHADFGDGNFTIDYENGNITTFDFDDSAYCWFMYDIADAWTKGIGWAMFENTIEKRKNKMDDYYGKIIKGYNTENIISDYWLSKLPFFIKIVEMESLISEYQNSIVNGEEIEEDDEEMNYKIECIEKDIPYLGLFDKIYNHENPFCLM